MSKRSRTTKHLSPPLTRSRSRAQGKIPLPALDPPLIERSASRIHRLTNTLSLFSPFSREVRDAPGAGGSGSTLQTREYTTPPSENPYYGSTTQQTFNLSINTVLHVHYLILNLQEGRYPKHTNNLPRYNNLGWIQRRREGRQIRCLYHST